MNRVIIFIFFAMFFLTSKLNAQYLNTDSLVIVPGEEYGFFLEDFIETEYYQSGAGYENNLFSGELMLQFGIPGKGNVISRFGPRSGRMHYGTDIKMTKGDTVYAVYNGSVSRASYYYGYGYLVVIQHAKNLETYYGHLSKFLVKNGQWLTKGQPIGLAGATGRATTSHLHLEIRENGQAYDPELVFDFENGRIRNEVVSIENLASLHKELKPKGYSVNQPVSQKYVVRPGDSLSKISRNTKTTIKSLCKLNNLTETSILQIGQVLYVY